MDTEAGFQPQDWVPIFETTNVSLLLVVKSVLDASNINYTVQGEEASSLLPLGPFGQGISNRHGFGARIHVPEDQADDARELLAILDREPTADDADAGG